MCILTLLTNRFRISPIATSPTCTIATASTNISTVAVVIHTRSNTISISTRGCVSIQRSSWACAICNIFSERFHCYIIYILSGIYQIEVSIGIIQIIVNVHTLLTDIFWNKLGQQIMSHIYKLYYINYIYIIILYINIYNSLYIFILYPNNIFSIL